ncbi:MAG: S8 family serine peptidase [Verrucomicrobiae bacterium]|nr:S8 family serine peptidase [Verrucomicrobiae bacterium]
MIKTTYIKKVFYHILTLFTSTFLALPIHAKSVAESFEELFRSCPIISEEVSQPDARGTYTRVRLVKTEEIGAELVRLEATIQKDFQTGREHFLSYRADVADEVMVELKRGYEKSALEALLQNLGIAKFRITEETLLPGYVIKILNPKLNSVPELVEYLNRQPQVDFAESDGLGLSAAEDPPTKKPNDPKYQDNEQDNLYLIDAPEAWHVTTGSKDVVVAVIDTGVDWNHEDLKGNIWVNSGEIPNNGKDDDKNGFVDDIRGWDFFLKDSNSPMDNDGHGTSVAGIIGAVGNNNKGIVGVNWKVSIMSLKSGNHTHSKKNIIKSIYYACKMGADVINISIYGPHSVKELNAVKYAQKQGVLIVACAGNDGEENKGYANSYEFPASYNGLDNVISVAAAHHTYNNKFESYSNYSKKYVDLAAPVAETTLNIGNSYRYFNGTSAATPHVVGVAALIKSVQPTWKAKEIKNLILATVDKVPEFEDKVKTGGRLNAYKSILNANPGKIRMLTESPIKVKEQPGGKLVPIEMERVDGNYGKVTVNLSKVDGSATQGLDYKPEIIDAVWGPGEMGKKYLTFRILDDNEDEYNEWIFAHLKIQGDAVWEHKGGNKNTIKDVIWEHNGGNKDIVSIQILDNEPKGIVRFKKSLYKVEESVGTVQVEVERVGGASGSATVNYKLYSLIVKKGSQGPVGDFIPPFEGKVSWANGESGVKTFPIHVRQDNVKEDEEDMFRLKLTPVNGTAVQNGLIPFIIKASDYDNKKAP